MPSLPWLRILCIHYWEMVSPKSYILKSSAIEVAILAMCFHWGRCLVELHPFMIERYRRQYLKHSYWKGYCLYHWIIEAPQESIIT